MTTVKVYNSDTSSWEIVGIGAQGVQGTNGAQGVQGPQGVQGLAAEDYRSMDIMGAY